MTLNILAFITVYVCSSSEKMDKMKKLSRGSFCNLVDLTWWNDPILYLFSTCHLICRLPLVWQAASLRQLEEENQEAAARLEEVVYRGDMLLEKIQSALADIAQSQLRTRSGAPSQPSPPESWHRPATTKHGLYHLYTAGILYSSFSNCRRSCVKCTVCFWTEEWFWFHSDSGHWFPSHMFIMWNPALFSTW